MASIAAMVTPHTALNFGLFVQASSNRTLEKLASPRRSMWTTNMALFEELPRAQHLSSMITNLMKCSM